jgi:hypothetical protein
MHSCCIVGNVQVWSNSEGCKDAVVRACLLSMGELQTLLTIQINEFESAYQFSARWSLPSTKQIMHATWVAAAQAAACQSPVPRPLQLGRASRGRLSYAGDVPVPHSCIEILPALSPLPIHYPSSDSPLTPGLGGECISAAGFIRASTQHCQ